MASTQNTQSVLNKSRLDKFLLVFELPPSLKDINVRDQGDRNSKNVMRDTMHMSVYGAIVPELTVAAIEIPYGGSNLYQSAHAREPYPPVTVNFTIDNEFNNYWVIYKWLNLMHDQKTGIYDQDGQDNDDNFTNYQTSMTLYGLDEYENRRIEFTYTKAFPTILGNIEYNYRTTGEIEASFTFVYSQLHTKLLNL
jgi:hypothetical protein